MAAMTESQLNESKKDIFLSVLGAFLEDGTPAPGSGVGFKKENGYSEPSRQKMRKEEASSHNDVMTRKESAIMTEIVMKRFQTFSESQTEVMNYIKGIDTRLNLLQKMVVENGTQLKSIGDRADQALPPSTPRRALTQSQSITNAATAMSPSELDIDSDDDDEGEDEEEEDTAEPGKIEDKADPKQEEKKEEKKKKTVAEILEEKTKRAKEPPAHQFWNSLVVFIILYNLSSVPFRIAFMHPYERFFIWGDFISFIIYISDYLFRYQSMKTAHDKNEQEKIVRRLLNQTEREAIKKQFDSFDKDGNGAISPNELALVMKSIGETATEEEIKKIIAEVDINQNGTIEFNEFVEFVEKFRVGKANQKKFGEVFIKNALLDVRSVWFYMDFLCSLPLHLIFGLHPLRLFSLLLPSNIFIFLFNIGTSFWFYNAPHAESKYPYTFLSTLFMIRFKEEFFSNWDPHLPTYLQEDSQHMYNTLGSSLETTQFLLILQLLKFAQLYTLVHELEKRTRYIKPSLFRLIHLVMLSFLIAHWVGCSWFLVGRLEGYGSNDWVPSLSLVRSSLITQYIRALYWGFVNTTNIESASPTNTVEAIFSLAVLFVGVSMYATIIGNVGSLLSNLDSTAVMFREKIDSVTAYMHYKEIPPALQARVHDYYEYLWLRQKGLDEAEILRDLPNSMKTDIALFLNREIIEKVPFFKNASENLISVLVRLLKPQVCAPGEFIIRFGDIGREMYFINRGVVVVCSEDGKTIYNVLSDGSFFGEYAILFSQRRSASVQSTTYCDLFVLTQEDFQTVLEDFPEFALAMRKEGVKRIVEKLSLFKDFSKEFRDHLIELLKPQSFVGGEYIIRKGDLGNEMYFLCKGNVEVCSGDGKTVYKVLHDGEFFGELALLTSQRRTASVRTVGYCELFVLTRSDLNVVLKKFPKFKRRIRIVRQQYQATSKQQLEQNNQLNAN